MKSVIEGTRQIIWTRMDCASLFLTMHGIGLLQSDFGPTAVKMTAYPYESRFDSIRKKPAASFSVAR